MKRWESALAVLGGTLALFAVFFVAATTAGSPAATKPSATWTARVQQDSTYWRQLLSVMKPVPLRSMTDHRAYMLPGGMVIALHFDNMNLGKARNLNWVALGVPGRFCKDDQKRVEKEFGRGFTHFHDLKNDTHGGLPGATGVWFVHIAARDFTAPWGPVKAGQIDMHFMPTPAPACP